MRELLGVVVLDVERNVQADQVHHLERPGGRAQIELVHPVNVLRTGHTFGDHGQRFALDGGPDAIEDEAGALPACLEGVDAELRQDGQQGVEQPAVGLTVGHQVERIDFRWHVKVRVA